MKGSPLLHISSTVSQGDKGGCWSNTKTNRQWQKHTFIAQRLALISDSAKSHRERQVSAFELELCRGGLSLKCRSMHKLYKAFISNPLKHQMVSRNSAEHWAKWCSKGWSSISTSVTENLTNMMLVLNIRGSGGLIAAYYRGRIVEGLTAVSCIHFQITYTVKETEASTVVTVTAITFQSRAHGQTQRFW